MSDISLLIKNNETRWSKAKLTRDFSAAAKDLVAGKSRYKAVEARTGVPWWIIAVIHEREASLNWYRSIAQGDPWDHVSTHEPKGRGPFASWEAAAVDALVNCSPFLAHKDWSSAGAVFTNLEAYNGLGYFNGPVTTVNGQTTHYPSQPSPYIWSGTNQYKSGKYIADHVFSPNVIDAQLGCAGLALAMMEIDPSIMVGGSHAISPAVAAAPAPTIPEKPKSLGEKIAAALAGIFTRKA